MSKAKKFLENDHLSAHCDVYITKSSNVLGLPPYPLPCNVPPSRQSGDSKSGGEVLLHYTLRFNKTCLFRCKFTPTTGHEGPEGEMYSPALSLTSALDGVGVQRHALAALPPGKTRWPLYRRLGGPQGRYGRVR